MHASSSLPRLPPVNVGIGTPANLPSAFQSNLKQSFTTKALNSFEDTAADADEPSGSGKKQRSSSYWAEQFRSQSKDDFLRGDVKPILERFEDTALYRQPNRKSLQTMLDEMNTTGSQCRQASSPVGGSGFSMLRRQASGLIVLQRRKSVVDAAGVLLKKKVALKASTLEPPPKVVPTRFLFDSTRCPRSSRCDYCNCAGGELECAACNIIAHSSCYLEAYEQDSKKSKHTFVAPPSLTSNSPFSSWLCSHCHAGLKEEYDERSANARAEHLAAQRQVLANSLTAYVRMTRDAASFAAKKAAIIRIQAGMRGRQARQRFVEVQRTRLKPYDIDSLRLRAHFPSGIQGSGNLGLGIGSSSSLEELRLGNGFSCNPFLYVTVVAGYDEDTQHFCFETSVRKPTALGSNELEIAWPDKMFVPGADGNATFCFTLLSKNGPNTFFLGQAILRLLDAGESWRTGAATELELMSHVEIFPKTAQHQSLPLADPGGNTPKLIDDAEENESDDEASFAKKKPRWVINVHIRPFSDRHSLCGYLNMKTTLESFHTSARWCVVADGILRIYRHFGVTLASDIVDMARATDVQVVAITSTTKRTANKGQNKTLSNPSEDEDANAAPPNLPLKGGLRSRKQSRLPPQHCCLAINHLNRLYLFQCEKNEHREWLKKLQGAQKFNALSSQALSPHATTASGQVGSMPPTSRVPPGTHHEK